MSDQRFPAAALIDWTRRAFASRCVPDRDARTTAEVLVNTNLRGVDTHGVTRVASYLQKLECGEVNPRPQFSHSEINGALHFKGDGGLGQPAAMAAFGLAIDRAREVAFVPAVLKDVGHLGALGMFCLHAARAGFISLLAQATPPAMALPGARGPAIGNNPLAFGCPLPGRAPFVLDMAMSHVARGNVLIAARENKPIPEGWAIDEHGRATTDPHRALKGAMMPFGGYKGIALAMMVELLGGSLTGAKPPTLSETKESSASGHVGAFFFVVNPDLIVARPEFDQHIEGWVASYFDSMGAKGRLPGQVEAETERERNRNGIPLPEAIVSELQLTGQRVGVPFDVTRV